ncbi:MAG: MATE family efflux transporter, partial [Eubacterium sp.]|nr:MATE family efflux transporter [Eubacterium sp.]
MAQKKFELEHVLKSEKQSWSREAQVIMHLSLPAILAQLTSIAMQYIDAAMVGSLGASATA